VSLPFPAIATSLRSAVIEHYRRGDERPPARAWLNTIATNSDLTERRGQTLLELLYRRTYLTSLEGLRVLDAGCGFGALSVYFANKGATVDAVDPKEERMRVGREVAERHGLAVRFRAGWMEELSYRDAAFDLVVMNNSLCYVVDPEARRRAISEVHRVIRPGGWLLVRDPNRTTPIDPFSRLPLVHFAPPATADRLAAVFRRHRSSVRLLTVRAARRELKAAGFAVVEPARPTASRLPPGLRAFGRYHHLLAQRAGT
jgi:ubiquinone/menaquinone biosynthesis C-methylase UbiE